MIPLKWHTFDVTQSIIIIIIMAISFISLIILYATAPKDYDWDLPNLTYRDPKDFKPKPDPLSMLKLSDDPHSDNPAANPDRK